MKHSNGPWMIQDLGARAGYPNWHSFAVRSQKENVHIATVGNVDRYFEGKEEHNARLIAAAPDLLEACEGMVEAYGNCECIDPHVPNHCPWCIARAAIKRATP